MSNFKIGDIVSTKPHPYIKDIYNIKIAGDPTNVILLMVIVEIFEKPLAQPLKVKGSEVTFKNIQKCKCMWFSLKSNSFNEAWFDFDALKKINDTPGIRADYKENDIDFKNRLFEELINKSVIFKTSHLELRKIKETKVFESSLNKISDYSSLLNFVSPPLQIIDIKILEGKVHNKSTSKSDLGNKILSQISIKCRYFNASSDKWSEIFLPIETLKKIESVDDHLVKIENDRLSEKVYLYDYTQEDNFNIKTHEPITILQLFDITYINGLYSLKTFDLIHQEWKVLEIPLQGIVDNIEYTDIYCKESFPNFSFKKGSKSSDIDKLLKEFEQFIDEHEEGSKYLIITYLNKSQKITKRVLKDFFVVLGSTKKANTYLHGFCCKKREERSFNFSNIQSIQIFSKI